MAKTESKTKTGTGKTSGNKTSAPPPPDDKGVFGSTWLVILGTAAAVAVAAGIFAYRGGFSQDEPGAPKKDPDVAELMAPGPLEDIVMGKADAPNTIVEYASMTCPHCAQFHKDVLPELKAKYIDNGQVKLILREFPLDGLAVAAFMLARCSGPERYYPMVGALFDTQSTWAVPGPEGKEKLLLIAKQAGFSKERFDQCVGDKDLFNKIVEVRQRANDKFGVDSTPTFFVNGKRLTADHQLKDFEALLAGQSAPSDSASSAEGSAKPAEGAVPPSEAPATPPAGDASKPEGTPAQ